MRTEFSWYLAVKVSGGNRRIVTLLITMCVMAAMFSAVIHAQQTPTGERLEGFSLPLAKQKELKVTSPPKATMKDLVDVFARLTRSQKTTLGPLTTAERSKLQNPEGPVQRREQIGVTRQLERPLRVSGLTKAVTQAGSTATLAGGRVDVTPDGRLVWTTEISSSGATGIRVHIQDINLPQDARIYVTDGRSQVKGPVLSTPSFWTNTVFGSSIFVQVQVPQSAAELSSNAFSINEISHSEMSNEQAIGPRRGNRRESAEGLTSPQALCELQVFCSPPTPPPNPSAQDTLLETASLGVAHIRFIDGGGEFICSGGLLSDSRGNGIPFFLTAHHCFSSQSSASSLETFWRYRRVCGQAAPPLSTLPTTLGSTLLATNSQTDFTLVQLSQAPPAGSHFFRWTSEEIANATTTVYRIHHPRGFSQHMQISTVRPVNECPAGLPNPQFLYSNPETGETRGGSSGSLVFRANATTPEVVGQLFGACFNNPQTCGFWNVDGAFARTFPEVRQFLGDAPGPVPGPSPGPGQPPVISILRPQDNASIPANSQLEIVANVEDDNGIATVDLYWGRTNRFLPCPGPNGTDWRCSKEGNEYKWILDIGSAGSRLFYIRATDIHGTSTIASCRIVQVR
jgi:Trypsin-like peptidase domain/Bacterial Ig domain